MLRFDFREGGSYRFAYHVPGTTTVIVAGSYSVIKPPSKIVFSSVIEPPGEHAGIQSHDINQLAGSGNTNDGEEDVLENDVVQESIVVHLLTLASIIKIFPNMEI